MLENGWLSAFSDLFGTSAIIWTALAAGLAILARVAADGQLRRNDILVAAGVSALVLVPSSAVSMVALTLFSCYAIATSASGSPARRSGVIFLSVAGSLIWGRLLLAWLSRPLLGADAQLVSALIGAQHQGNLIWLEGQPLRLAVAPGCSSMQGLSLALVLWVTVNQYFRIRFGWKPLLWCLAALTATVAVNVLRIGAMLEFPAHFEAIHDGWGYHASMWTTLVLVAALCLYGGRDEIFDRS